MFCTEIFRFSHAEHPGLVFPGRRWDPHSRWRGRYGYRCRGVTGGLGTGDLLGGVIDTVDGLIGAVSGNTSAQASAGTDGANASGGGLLGTGLLAN